MTVVWTEPKVDVNTLRAMRTSIIVNGWMPGMMFDMVHGTSSMCLLGHAATVNGYDVKNLPVRLKHKEEMERWTQFANRLSDALRISSTTGVPNWNDKEGRTIEEVFQLLDRAIFRMEAQEAEVVAPAERELVAA